MLTALLRYHTSDKHFFYNCLAIKYAINQLYSEVTTSVQVSIDSKHFIISTWVPRNNKQIRTESTYYSKYLIFTVSTQLILLYKRHSEKLIFTFYQIYRNMIVLTIAFRLWAKLNSVWFTTSKKLSPRSYSFLIER